MITFRSEEDSAAAFKIDGSTHTAILPIKASKDSESSNWGDAADLLSSEALQGKKDSGQSLNQCQAHLGKAFLSVKSIVPIHADENILSSNNLLHQEYQRKIDKTSNYDKSEVMKLQTYEKVHLQATPPGSSQCPPHGIN